MKANIMEIGFSTQKLGTVQDALQECLRQHGGTVIGFQTGGPITLLALRLSRNAVVPYLLKLSSALNEEIIHSFQMLSCILFKVVFRQEYTKIALKDFPLHAGERWFPAVNDETMVYICLASPYLSQEQIAWLARQPGILQWTQEL